MFPIEKPLRIRSRPHMAFVAKQPCFVCGARPVQVHHVQHAQPRGRGLKTGDQFTIGLCLTHHMAVHNFGSERKYWDSIGKDAIEYATSLWNASEANHGN